MQSCKFKPSSVKSKPGKTRVQSLCACANPAPSAVNESVWKLVSNMTQDDICHDVVLCRVMFSGSLSCLLVIPGVSYYPRPLLSCLALII